MTTLPSIRSSCSEDVILAIDAIERGDVVLAYQPVVQAADHGQIAFHEGLARVIDPSGRIIPAGVFIEAIEATEWGRMLDTLALDEGLRALSVNPDLRLSINLSTRTIGFQPWQDTLDAWIAKDELIAERLILELTESSAMECPERVSAFMQRLQLKGICFAMDDFGAGYTALRFFKDFRFDMVKIDGRFARNISSCPDNRAVVAALVSLANHFDMLTVAECVETAEDAETLRGLGVNCLQGYHFARPELSRDRPGPHRTLEVV